VKLKAINNRSNNSSIDVEEKKRKIFSSDDTLSDQKISSNSFYYV